LKRFNSEIYYEEELDNNEFNISSDNIILNNNNLLNQFKFENNNYY